MLCYNPIINMVEQKKIHFPVWTIPIVLLGVSFLAYGSLLPYLGVYWDDLPTLWFYKQWGAGVFSETFASDRPFLGMLFQITMPILGEKVLYWQLFGILTRGLTSVTFFYLLQQLWRNHPVENFLASVLFGIYPGFGQQWVAVTYSHVFLAYAAFLASLSLMLIAAYQKEKAWLYIVIALLFDAFSLFVAEYFIGLELLRPFLLWFVIRRERQGAKIVDSIRSALRAWIPYFCLLVGFSLWRTVIHPFPRGELTFFYNAKMNVFEMVWTLLINIFQDVSEASFLAWSLPLNLVKLFQFNTELITHSFILFVVVGVFTWIVLYLPIQTESSLPQNHNWGKQATVIGGVALLFGGIPTWITSLRLHLTFPADRFTLAMAFGASLLLMGLIYLFMVNVMKRNILLSLLIGLTCVYHYQAADVYRIEWQALRNLFWQLSWRVPNLQPHTSLLTYGLPFTFYTDNSLTAPLQWMYFPHDESKKLNTALVDYKTRLDENARLWEGNTPINLPYRAVSFKGNTSQSLVIYSDDQSCLQVLDPSLDIYNPKYPAAMYRIMSLSNLDNILDIPSQTVVPPTILFGLEPSHSWCYYYQKAALARQRKDWEAILKLSVEAQEKGYLPMLPIAHAHEYLPFIEAYAWLGYNAKAKNFSHHALNQSYDSLRPMLCTFWREMSLFTLRDGSSERGDLAAQMQVELRCSK